MTLHSLSRSLLVAALLVSLGANAAFAQSIRFWTTEEQPDRLAKQQAMAAGLP